MKMLKQLIVFMLTLVSLTACSKELVTMKMAVIDDEGVPVSNARVSMSFLSGNSFSDVVEFTNSDGFIKASRFSTQETAFSITKEDFYKTKSFLIDGSHEVTVVLKRIKNPIPMYVKKTHLLYKLAEDDNYADWVGYDLMAGDFLPPHGKGVVKDFEFTYVDDRKDMWNYTEELVIKFPGEFDGLVLMDPIDHYSVLWSDYLAPASGYINEYSFYERRNSEENVYETTFDKSRKYYFRVRSKVDKDGKLVSAHYGKFYDEFGKLFYYFNPNENDRNVEFKVGENLFGTPTNNNDKIFNP